MKKTTAYELVMAEKLKIAQREQRAMPPIKVGQKMFREFCGTHGAVMDVMMSADLVRRVEAIVEAERAHD